MSGERLLRLPQVIERVPGCRAWLYALIAEGKFPKPIRIGRSVFWPASRVDAWIAEQIAAQDDEQ